MSKNVTVIIPGLMMRCVKRTLCFKNASLDDNKQAYVLDYEQYIEIDDVAIIIECTHLMTSLINSNSVLLLTRHGIVHERPQYITGADDRIPSWAKMAR